MKGKITAFVLSGTLVVSGISQIVLADENGVNDPIIQNEPETKSEEGTTSTELDSTSSEQTKTDENGTTNQVSNDLENEEDDNKIELLDLEEAVAKIGETEYDDIDECISAAQSGDTIVLLKDVAPSKTFYKDLTFTGGHTISYNVYGWRYKGNLTFDNASFVLKSDASSAAANNGETGRWFSMVLSGSLNVTNGGTISFDFDSTSGTTCAIYTETAKINVTNGSHFKITGHNTKGKTGEGIQLGSTANTTINVSGGSDFLIDGANRGYVNSPTINVENAKFTVQNCTANGSNGGAFTATNAKINFINNNGHGLSATTLDLNNSKVYTNKNAYYGTTVSSKLDIDSTSLLESNENGTGYTGGGLRLSSSNATGTIHQGATVSIKYNVRNGLENYGSLTFEELTNVTIMNNYEPNNGGGVYNGASGNLTLPSNAQIYNNHADKAGDDIYSKGIISFSNVGSNWILDDCNDLIDDWYYDGYAILDEEEYTDRWNVDGEYKFIQHYNASNKHEILALKAAHTLNYKVTVNYLEKGTNKVLKDAVVNDAIEYGTSFDATEYDKVDIKDYKYVETEVLSQGSDYEHDQIIAALSLNEDQIEEETENPLVFDFMNENIVINVYYQKDVKPEVPKKDSNKKSTSTSVQTNAKLYASTAVSALSLAGILTILKKRK
ncbi:hypothetical protein [Floccifex sp.]|uniref:hypothetical protein n=1 Tax=Floccifex sp. TaxID=2815810 RepID=UPI003EFE77F1